MTALGVRWTIGDVSPRGWEALRLSAWGASRVFGAEARYAVVVNSVPLREAQARAGAVPPGVRSVGAAALPPALERLLDAGMAEGVA